MTGSRAFREGDEGIRVREWGELEGGEREGQREGGSKERKGTGGEREEGRRRIRGLLTIDISSTNAGRSSITGKKAASKLRVFLQLLCHA